MSKLCTICQSPLEIQDYITKYDKDRDITTLKPLYKCRTCKTKGTEYNIVNEKMRSLYFDKTGMFSYDKDILKWFKEYTKENNERNPN